MDRPAFWYCGAGAWGMRMSVRMTCVRHAIPANPKAAGHQPLPDHGKGLRAGLQRVELVLPGSPPEGKDGSHHQPAAAAGGGGKGDPQRRANNAVPDPAARQANLLKVLIANTKAPSGNYLYNLGRSLRGCFLVRSVSLGVIA